MPMDRKQLQQRLENFGTEIIVFSKQLLNEPASDHLRLQIIRSGTAPALHYAESGDAESLKDFIHKLKIAAKELRETLSILRIIKQTQLSRSELLLMKLLNENDELIAIMVSSIKTSSENHRSKIIDHRSTVVY